MIVASGERRGSTPLRARDVGFVACGAFICFVALAAIVWHAPGPVGPDGAITRVASGVPRAMLLPFTEWEALAVVVAATAALLALGAMRRDWFLIALSALAPLTAGLLCEVVAKPLIDRWKGTSPAFPSGHATLAAAIATLVVIAYLCGRLQWPSVAFAAAFAAVVSSAVVLTGSHYLTDAIGGAALGVASVCGMAAALAVVGLGHERRARSARTNRFVGRSGRTPRFAAPRPSTPPHAPKDSVL